MKKFLICCFLLTLIAYSAVAQPTKVRGKITDAKTGKPVPFVTVIFKGTTTGAISDFKGNYFLETRKDVDSIQISLLGYTSQTKAIHPHGFKTININLEENIDVLDEVVVTPGENPAHRILRGIIANKAKNNPDRSTTYEYDGYTKLELSLTNITEKMKRSRIMRNFQFVFDYVDTSAVTGKAYLPFLISEMSSEVYHSNKPKLTKRIIKASKVSGFDKSHTSVTQFTERLRQKFNIYDNYMRMFEQGFISPTNNNGLLFYRYYLIDSAQYKGEYCYHLSFKPRNKQDPVFVGDCWVTASDFAIVDINMRVTDDVNINWINDIAISESFHRLQDSTWFWKQRKLIVDFILAEKDSTKQKGFLGKSTINFKNVKLNIPMSDKYRKISTNVKVLKDAVGKSEEYWSKNRPYELSQSEKDIYKMVDSIKNVPLYRNIADIIHTLVRGYYRLGKVEIGPYYKLATLNDIEGFRFQFGARTTKKWSKKLRLSAYAGYGFKDKELKYKLGALYRFTEQNDLWVVAGLNYQHDLDLLGKSVSKFFTTRNILTSLLARGNKSKLVMINELEGYYENEWIDNLSNRITFSYKHIFPSSFVPFTPVGRAKNVIGSPIKIQEISLNTRWSPNESILRRPFQRKHLRSNNPVINFDLSMGVGDYKYQKLDLSIQQTIPIYPIGHTYYYLKAGQIFGKVPFPLLYLHEGNQTYILDKHAYNMMNYYEFASDRYVGLSVEHHFMGFFINKIPLLKLIKARAVVTGKALWGTLREENNPFVKNSSATVAFPEGLSELKTPYFEVGAGLENIFRLFRVDALWRLSHLENTKHKFSVSATLQLTF